MLVVALVRSTNLCSIFGPFDSPAGAGDIMTWKTSCCGIEAAATMQWATGIW